jgi:hypothetical protein
MDLSSLSALLTLLGLMASTLSLGKWLVRLNSSWHSEIADESTIVHCLKKSHNLECFIWEFGVSLFLTNAFVTYTFYKFRRD